MRRRTISFAEAQYGLSERRVCELMEWIGVVTAMTRSRITAYSCGGTWWGTGSSSTGFRRIAPQPPSAAIAIEIPHGAPVEGLLARDFCVFSIDPRQLDRFWDCYFPAGVRDDRKDALLLTH